MVATADAGCSPEQIEAHCGGGGGGGGWRLGKSIRCARVGPQTVFAFPAGGVFPVTQQFRLPPNTSIVGAANPNDPEDKTRQQLDVAAHTWFVVPAAATLCRSVPAPSQHGSTHAVAQ